MATTNFIVTSLPDYVQQNRDLIIKNFGLVGAGTRGRVSIQTGIKKSAYLNYLDLGVVFQDGSDCGFNPLGSIELTNRTIDVAAIKVNDEICPKNLLGKYAEYLVRLNATEDSLPFEQYIMDTIVASVNKEIERMIWQGDTDSEDTTLEQIDGWLKLMGANNDVVKLNNLPAGAYEGILAVYMAMTEETLDRGGEIYVSPAIYRAFLQEMVVKNYYHYSGPQAASPDEFMLPGTEVKVVKTPGLKGSLQIVGTFPKNLVYGTDMEHDEEDVKLWFSNDDDVFKYKILFAAGVQFYFPDQIVLGTFSAAPGIGTGVNESLASIAASAATLAGTVNEDGQIETHPNADPAAQNEDGPTEA